MARTIKYHISLKTIYYIFYIYLSTLMFYIGGRAPRLGNPGCEGRDAGVDPGFLRKPTTGPK